MGKIILLNGPPSSGKDTAAKHIYRWAKMYEVDRKQVWRPALDRMSMSIKRAFAGTMGLPITEDGEVQPWESCKEEIIPEFGVSYRQWQIDFSEHFMKLLYDDAIFGQLAVARIKRRFEKNIANLIVIPDCGFYIEIEVLYQNFNPEDILLLRCHRDGFTFQGDSRSYVRAPSGCAVGDLMNEDKDAYLALVERTVKTWLESPEKLPREE